MTSLNPDVNQLPMRRQTVFSLCRQYRYTLWREWGVGTLPLMQPNQGRDSYAMFIGLNPSTADETKDDPTIRKCIGFAKRWGYGALCMTNLFAFRATDPRDMMAAKDPLGPDNVNALLECARDAGIIIAAWGNHGSFQGWGAQVAKMLPKLYQLKLNKDGSPAHPLYVRYEVTPQRYDLP